jgi:hypothetical protein
LDFDDTLCHLAHRETPILDLNDGIAFDLDGEFSGR